MKDSVLLALALGFALMSGEPARPQTAPAPRSNDYGDPANWLCKPGRQDVCSGANQDATVVQVDGSTSLDLFHPDPKARVDCFYVYPTVSRDRGGNATMATEPEEVQVVAQQFARFAATCRLFAPVYRQVTLTALTAGILGKPIPTDRLLAYRDVLDAWNYYLAHDNHGHGVVLIGHSQGSGVLIELVKAVVDGKPVQGKILSVILGGARLQVPVGQDVGGDFKSIPLCHSTTQIGCAINFASFRSTSPPPANSRFGASSGPGLEAACVNPAALGGGTGVLHAYLASGANQIVAASTEPVQPWTTPPTTIKTPFVEVPGMLSAACVNDGSHSYLAITVHADPAGRRTNQIAGDVLVGGQVLKDWGLHLIDMNLTMGDLVGIVGDEAKVYLAKSR